MNPAIQVQHIFNYSLLRSLRNAFTNRSTGLAMPLETVTCWRIPAPPRWDLSFNVCIQLFNGLMLAGYLLNGKPEFLVLLSVALAFNLFVNRGLLLAFRRAEGLGFAVRAALYYLLLYPVAVAAGAGAGLMLYFHSPGQFRGNADDDRTNEAGLLR